MGINVKFTIAVIAVAVIGFTASSYFFSTQPISGDWMFDKSQYIQKIDACLETQTSGNISLNSFATSFVTNLKEQAEAAESENEIKEILDKLYEITSCEPYYKISKTRKKCIICGCQDHRLVGCIKHKTKKCSCYNS